MVTILEPYWRGLSHASSNALLIRVVRAAYGDVPILFLADKRHIDAVVADVPDVEVRTQAIDVPDEEAGLYGRLHRDWRNVGIALRQLRSDKDGILVFCSAHGSVLALCALGQRLKGRKGDRILARLHGNLNAVSESAKGNPLRRALSLDSAMKLAHDSGVRLVVLEQSIRDELSTLRPDLPRVGVLEEPATIGGPSFEVLPSPDRPVRFAFLGLGTRAKGVDRFLAAADEVHRRAKGRVEFEIIGRLHPSMAHLSTSALAHPIGDAAIPRRAYIEMLSRQHYVCAFYDPDYYRLSASGVLLDAITYRKPLITTEIPFMRNLFARFGDLGEICRSDEDIVAALVRAASAVDLVRYQRQIENLARVAEARRVSEVARQLRAAIEGRH